MKKIVIALKLPLISIAHHLRTEFHRIVTEVAMLISTNITASLFVKLIFFSLALNALEIDFTLLENSHVLCYVCSCKLCERWHYSSTRHCHGLHQLVS